MANYDQYAWLHSYGIHKSQNVTLASGMNRREKLLKQAEKLHNNRQEIATAKKVRIIASGGGRPPKLSISEQIILTLTWLLTFDNISTTRNSIRSKWNYS